VVGFAVLGGEDGYLAGETVTKVVASGARCAFGCFGSVGTLRVPAIRFELFF
jgi:hypothetical protein